MQTQTNELYFRAATAVGVVFTVLASIHGLATLSHNNIERSLAQQHQHATVQTAAQQSQQHNA
ncbi:hypothetical protein [Chitinimonas sp. BJYL2]|uniref:hypothetical protein n=1 Tax=Chitinimonas sp. BJYL2 TaxID=2976696 RepID=UPI0022B2ED74|nr:hypothetical protein [Chitinimonas sp. BJYL2]